MGTSRPSGPAGDSRSRPRYDLQNEGTPDSEELKWTARHWAARMEVKLLHIHVRPMVSKWASISTAGRLTLNAELLSLPKELGEFVVVHELVHLLTPKHGKLFTSFMSAYLPDWEQREQQLQIPAAFQEKAKRKEPIEQRFLRSKRGAGVSFS
jgi:Protein of unknown function DUF45